MSARAKTGIYKSISYGGDYKEWGDIGEQMALLFAENNPKVLNVQDFRELRIARQADIDFGWQLLNGTNPLAEVKCDTYLGISGNILYELLRFNHTASPASAFTLGWSARSPATYFIYYAPIPHKLYIAKSDDLTKAAQDFSYKERRGFRNALLKHISIVITDAGRTTLNLLIPFKEYKNIFSIYELPEDWIVPKVRQLQSEHYNNNGQDHFFDLLPGTYNANPSQRT